MHVFLHSVCNFDIPCARHSPMILPQVPQCPTKYCVGFHLLFPCISQYSPKKGHAMIGYPWPNPAVWRRAAIVSGMKKGCWPDMEASRAVSQCLWCFVWNHKEENMEHINPLVMNLIFPYHLMAFSPTIWWHFSLWFDGHRLGKVVVLLVQDPGEEAIAPEVRLWWPGWAWTWFDWSASWVYPGVTSIYV